MSPDLSLAEKGQERHRKSPEASSFRMKSSTEEASAKDRSNVEEQWFLAGISAAAAVLSLGLPSPCFTFLDLAVYPDPVHLPEVPVPYIWSFALKASAHRGHS